MSTAPEEWRKSTLVLKHKPGSGKHAKLLLMERLKAQTKVHLSNKKANL